MSDPKLPRGVRNSNPGNLRDEGISWTGLASPPADKDGYLIFVKPIFGIRALARDLLVKYRKDKLRTVAAIVSKYAPPNENDTAAYVQALSRALGVAPEALINLDDPGTLLSTVQAVIRHECGVQPYPLTLIANAIDAAMTPPIPYA